MTSTSSEEHPQFYARSKTPESPRPVHIPEPSNIPVLENQTDPIFNLMSTHLEPPFAARNMTAMDHEIAQLTAAQAAHTPVIEAAPYEEPSSDNITTLAGEDTRVLEKPQEVSPALQDTGAAQDQSDASLNLKQSTSFSVQPPASVDTLESPVPAVTNLQPSPSSSHPTTETLVSPPNPVEASNTDGPANADEKLQDTNHESTEDTEVNYQALLDNIVSANGLGTPAASNPSASTTQAPESADFSTSSTAHLLSANLAPPVGLPPRPPPQEKPAIHPNYVPGQDITTYHFPQAHHANSQSSQNSIASNSYRPSQFPPNIVSPALTGPGSNGLPPPPMASFQQPLRAPEQPERSPAGFTQQQEDMVRNGGKPERGSREDESQWPRDIQTKYDQFLLDEEVYTKEGAWDKFPRDSRLFVGNLPTEIVTKRDIFHIFHRFGRLAQISIKQAYGFVQFMDKEACEAALREEQGGKIKERNMHLEISKPPKNSRNQASAAGEQLRASHYRRSRSPDRRQGTKGQRNNNNNDRYNRNPPFSDFRDEPRRRDDYRPVRSPSPRGFRARDNYRAGRERSPAGYRGGRERSRSPYGRGSRYNRSPSPRRRSVDDDDMLPIPKRHPRDVPDVQLLMFDDFDRPFVEYVEKGFRDRGLRVAVLIMPNASLTAIIRRQIVEGVLAVVKLYRDVLTTGRFPIQIFDRSAGASNVRFEEYAEALSTAAELVVRAKQKQAAASTIQAQFSQVQPQQAFATLQQYGIPAQQIQAALPSQQQLPPSAAPTQQQQPNLANLISTLDGPALQKLLSAMQASPPQQQQPGIPQASPTGPPNQDLQALLGNITKQQAGMPHTPVTPQSAGFPAGGYPPPQHQPPQQQQLQGGYGQYGGGGGYPPPQQQSYPQQHAQQPYGMAGGPGGQANNVQAMLDQITRGAGWK